jgi:hypothetical protein
MSSFPRALAALTLAAASFLGAVSASATEKPSAIPPAGLTPGAIAPAEQRPLFELDASRLAPMPAPRTVEAPPFDFPKPDPAAACSACNLLSWFTPPPFDFEGSS